MLELFTKFYFKYWCYNFRLEDIPSGEIIYQVPKGKPIQTWSTTIKSFRKHLLNFSRARPQRREGLYKMFKHLNPVFSLGEEKQMILKKEKNETTELSNAFFFHVKLSFRASTNSKTFFVIQSTFPLIIELPPGFTGVFHCIKRVVNHFAIPPTISLACSISFFKGFFLLAFKSESPLPYQLNFDLNPVSLLKYIPILLSDCHTSSHTSCALHTF